MHSLVITKTFKDKEFSPLASSFSLEKIKSASRLIKNGIGHNLKNNPTSYVAIKHTLTSKQGAGRICCVLIFSMKLIIPVILAKKNDKIGQNMSFDNKGFLKKFLKNINLVEIDLREKRIETYNI